MTISSTTRTAGPFIGNDTAFSFPFSFKVFAAADVLVVRTKTDTSVSTNLVLNSDYSVTLSPDQNSNPGGVVTLALSAPLATGYSLVLTSQLAYLQPLDLTNQGGFYPRVITDAFDRITIFIQQLASIANRSLRFPVADTGVNTELPQRSSRANNLLGFDASGNPIAVAPNAQSATALQALLAASGGAGLIGWIQAGTGAVSNTVLAELRRVVTPPQFGGKGDGSDDTAALAAMFSAVQNGQTIDLLGKSYALYVGLGGTAAGDAIALASMPRLYGKSNIAVRNGSLYAANPAVSGAKVRFPSTLAIDGCSDIRFIGVVLKAKGESYGASDDSQPLTSEQRRPFLAQNGGHACVVIRSSKIYFDASCRLEKAGSVGALYSSSSDEVVLNGAYASAESLGYAAFAVDSWCGGSATSGFARHRLYLNNCRSDNNGASYGSKGCVVAEDRESYVYVNGGTYKDAYANGSATFLGMAFSSNGAHVYVDGAEVENCAAIGMTTNNITDDTVLECKGVTARSLRTSMHIIDATSIGAHKIKYRGCDAEIVGTSLWGAAELSRSTVVANRKVTTPAEVDIVDCRTSGAHTFTINTSASYGGLRVVGGHHTVTDRIFDSAGWGGAGAGTMRGYELLSGAVIRVLLANTAVVSNALTQATNSINAIKNQDASNVFTYQYIQVDKSVSITANLMRDFMALSLFGSGLQERRVVNPALTSCYLSFSPGEPRAGSAKVVSLDGISGSNYKVTFAFPEGKSGDTMTLADDVSANRRAQGTYSGPNMVSGLLQYGVYLNGTAANLSVGAVYPASFSG